MTSTAEGMPNVGQIDFGDGNDIVSVVPPLEPKEIHSMEWAGALDPGYVIEETVDSDPPSSRFDISEVNRELTLEEKKNIATRIAYALSLLRKGSVELSDGTVITNPYINNLA
jgi:hypothetical protein